MIKPHLQASIHAFPCMKIYRKKWRLTGYLFCTIGFAVFGVILIRQAHHITEQIIGWLALIFFGGMTYLWGKEWVATNRPILQIDQNGIVDCSSAMVANRLILWHEIQSIHTERFAKQMHIGIKLHDEAAYLNQLTGSAKKLAQLNHKMGYSVLYVNVHASPYSAEEIADILEQYRQHFSGSLKHEQTQESNKI